MIWCYASSREKSVISGKRDFCGNAKGQSCNGIGIHSSLRLSPLTLVECHARTKSKNQQYDTEAVCGEISAMVSTPPSIERSFQNGILSGSIAQDDQRNSVVVPGNRGSGRNQEAFRSARMGWHIRPFLPQTVASGFAI